MRYLTPKVFVSATSQDLASYRHIVKEELLTAGILPVTQENFGPDYRSLEEFLKFEISNCDAIICLVGSVFGNAPKAATATQRSYAQIEYDIAKTYNKPIFIFLTENTYIPDNITQENDIQKELQRRHYESLMNAGHKWERFKDKNDLRLKVAQAIIKIGRPSGHPPMFYLHLPKKPSYFVGRIKEKNQLRDALFRKTPSVVVVVGMGGQGKTTLVHKALGELETFPFVAGFWCTAYRGGFTFDMFLDNVLSHLLNDDFDKRDIPDVSARITRLLSILQDQPILLVIDGIERWLWGWNSGIVDPQGAESDQDRAGFYIGLDGFLREASSLTNGTHLIITTRALPAALDQAERTHIPVHDEDGKDVSLEGLDPVAAAHLLASLGVKGTQDELLEVAESYANHPLALTILGALLKKKYGGRLDRLPRVTAMDPRLELYKLFDEIRENLPGRESTECFLAIASACIENPSLEVIAAGMHGFGEAISDNYDNLVEKVVMLADWNLIWWDATNQTVTLHPLVKNYFGSLLDENSSRRIHRNLSEWYRKQPINAAPSSLEDVKYRILAIKHAARATDLSLAANLMFTPMSDTRSLFSWFSEWGHQFFGVEVMGELAAVAEGELRGIFLLSQAQMYHQLARPQLAIEGVGEAITIFEKLIDNSSHQVKLNYAKALATRGNIHLETARSAMAILDFNSTIDILEKVAISDSDAELDLAKTLVNRGNALHSVGALSRAMLDYNRAYDLWMELSAKNPISFEASLAPTLLNRGNTLLELGKIDDAINDFENSISICEQHQRTGNQNISSHLAHAKSMLGLALTRSEQPRKGLILGSEAVAALETLVDAGRKDCVYLLALALINRAEDYMLVKQYDAAVHDCDRSVFIYQRLVVEAGSHFFAALAHALCIRAAARCTFGDWKGSEEDRFRGFAIYKEINNQWKSENELRVRYLRDLLKTIRYLLDSGNNAGISALCAATSRDSPGPPACSPGRCFSSDHDSGSW